MPAPADPDARDALRRELVDAETERVLARRGRTLIVAGKLGIVQAAAGIDGSNVRRDELALLPVRPGRERGPAARRAARRGSGSTSPWCHRHDGPVLAGRADRRRDRLGRARRAAPLRGRERRRGQRAAGHRGRDGRRAGRAPPTWSRASSAGCRSPWCAGCARSTTARPPASWCARSTRTCSGWAPTRRSRRAAGRRCCCAAAPATSPTSRSTPAALRRAVGVALTAPAPHHSTPFRFGWVRDPRRAAPRCSTRWRDALARAPGRPTGARPTRSSAGCAAATCCAARPELVLAFRTGDGMHTYPRRGPPRSASARCSPSRAARPCSRCWWRWPRRGWRRAGSGPRSSPPDVVRAGARPAAPTGSRSARSPSGCRREPLRPAPAAGPGRGTARGGSPGRRRGRAAVPGRPRTRASAALRHALLAFLDARPDDACSRSCVPGHLTASALAARRRGRAHAAHPAPPGRALDPARRALRAGRRVAARGRAAGGDRGVRHRRAGDRRRSRCTSTCTR